jgi:tetratricopeptide (TPR) repeat protein
MVTDSRRVFLSHTSELARFPERRSFVAAAKDAVARAGYAVADMEYFTAHESSPADYCREVMHGCDMYVGLIGLQYGSPVRDQPDVSYTELEFNVATQAMLTRLVFLLDEDAVPPLLPDALLEGESAFRARQAAFRQRLRDAGVTVRTVASPDRLELLLFQALLEARATAAGPAPSHPRPVSPDTAGEASGSVEFSAPAPVALAGLPAVEGFLGRADDLSTLDQILAPDTAGAETVIVSTVAGLAGVGKTAFAVRAAQRAIDAGWFPGGVVFVDLHGYDPNRFVDADAALGALIRALGVPNGQIPPERGEREALYRSRLAELAGQGRRVLIIADNASALEQVAPLRPGNPVHRMLVTSRHNLPLYDARRIEVDVLLQADAVAVVDRALRAANPGDKRIPNDMEAASRLVELCGYLPLALRITAELLADEPERPIAEMVEFLSDTRNRLGEIAYGDSLAVRAAFDASYQHLPADQQRLFRMLSLNPGPHIRINATAALADIPEPLTRQMLVALRRAHLIERAPSEGCYRFHDLLRLYAAECREQDESQLTNGAAVSRLLDYYLENARSADHHLDAGLADPQSAQLIDRPAALAWLNAERPNLIAAVSLAADTGHDSHARDIPLALFRFFDLRKHWAAWIATHQIALSAARRLGDRHGEGVVLNNLGVAYRQRRRFDEALACHAQSLDISESTGDRHGEGRALNNSGITHRDLRQFDAALACHQRAVAIFRDVSDRRGEAEALYNVGNTYDELRRFNDAVACFEQTLTLYRDVGDRYGEGWTVNGMGVAYRELRRFDDALDSFRQALTIRREIGDRHGEGHTLTNLGKTYGELMRFDEALDTLQQALGIRREIGDRHGEGMTLQCLGCVHRDLGQLDDALKYYQQALAAFKESNAPYDTEQTLDLIRNLHAGPSLSADPSAADLGTKIHETKD